MAASRPDGSCRRTPARTRSRRCGRCGACCGRRGMPDRYMRRPAPTTCPGAYCCCGSRGWMRMRVPRPPGRRRRGGARAGTGACGRCPRCRGTRRWCSGYGRWGGCDGRPRRSALLFAALGLDLDVHDGLVAALEVGGILQHVLLDLFLDRLDLDFGVLQAGDGQHLGTALVLERHVAAGAAQARLLGRLLGVALGTDRRLAAQVVEAGTARHADALVAEFGLRHRDCLAWESREGAAMPPTAPPVKR